MEKNRIIKKRTNNPKPIVITERDKAVLTKVAEYRLMSTEQLHRLCFPSLNRARKRLLQLQQHGYLKRIVRPIRMGEGSSMYLHLLTKKARTILPDNINITKKRSSSIFPYHSIGINDFRACLELSIRELKNISVNSWQQGKELLIKTAFKDKGIPKQIPIIPDAYFTIKHEQRIFHYFLEIDRGTADLKRIALKCRAYLNLWQEKAFENQYKIYSFRVLFVTRSEKRLSNMLEQLQKLKHLYQRLDIILIGSSETYSLTQPKRIFETIWRTLDSQANIRNISLLPSTPLQSSRQREENHHCAVQNPIPVNGTPGPGG